MIPWLAMAEQSNGLIFTNWHQTRSDDGGTRTGRLSSTPNFQNIPNEFKPIWAHEKEGLPVAPIELPPLPKVRGYVVPFKGHVLCGRDFASQELRVLAHFEGGPMMQSYLDDPTQDLHQYAADLITRLFGVNISRKAAKTIAFSILYGSGLGKLAEGLGVTVDDAKRLRRAYLGTFPGIKVIMDDLKVRAKLGTPIRTFGGREYYCEAPKLIEGRLVHFDYKLLNYVIQSSSADITKDALIRFAGLKTTAKLLASVHDEILISSPKNDWKENMRLLRVAMNDIPGLDVPMLSDGEFGQRWDQMTDWT
jgi:DNA polymerase-1